MKQFFQSINFSFLSIAVLVIVNSVSAQVSRPAPEMNVAGFQLGGSEEAAKTLLQNYSPRYDNPLGQPKFFFYNEYGDQVMSLTGYSKERPFLIVGIEVFAVGESYQIKHFFLKDQPRFSTESGFYIGEKASAKSLIFAVPNVTRPTELIKKKGAPDADEKLDKKRILRYQYDAKDLTTSAEDVNLGAYQAEYQFVNNRLRRFSITLAAGNSIAKSL